VPDSKEPILRAAMPVICIAEDRSSCEPAVRLLLMSLHRHCGNQRVELFYPPANREFRSWLERFPAVNLNPTPVPGAWGWNVKAQAILTLFERGYDDVLWIDSDILISRNFEKDFRSLPPTIMVLTEEALYGNHEDPNALRARLWGLNIGRTLPFTANTAILRATTIHANLLKRWISFLEDARYREAQRKEWFERPAHLYGDQDVLTALLTSEEYANVPVKFLRRGKKIIQFFGPYGYTLTERLHNIVFGMPPFIHSQVVKPWEKDNGGNLTGWRQPFNSLYLQLSPYTLSAREYRRGLPDAAWMEADSLLGKILRICGFYYPPLTGLPLAIVADTFLFAKRVFTNVVRRRSSSAPLTAAGADTASRSDAVPKESVSDSGVY
jgi:hypothetical protein